MSHGRRSQAPQLVSMDMTISTGRAESDVMLYPEAAESSVKQNEGDGTGKDEVVETESSVGVAERDPIAHTSVPPVAFPSPTGTEVMGATGAMALYPLSIQSTTETGPTRQTASSPVDMENINQQPGKVGADAPSSSAASSVDGSMTPPGAAMDGSARQPLLQGPTAPATDGAGVQEDVHAGLSPIGSGSRSLTPSPHRAPREESGRQHGLRQRPDDLTGPQPGLAGADENPVQRDAHGEASSIQLALNLAQGTRSAAHDHGDGHGTPADTSLLRRWAMTTEPDFMMPSRGLGLGPGIFSRGLIDSQRPGTSQTTTQAEQGAGPMGPMPGLLQTQRSLGTATRPPAQTVSGGHPVAARAPPLQLGTSVETLSNQVSQATQAAGVAQTVTWAPRHQQRATLSSGAAQVGGSHASLPTTSMAPSAGLGQSAPTTPSIDDLLAAVQLQIQQTQQVTAQMEQHRRAQEAMVGRLDQQMVTQQLMGEILQDLTPIARGTSNTRRTQGACGQSTVGLDTAMETNVKSYASGVLAGSGSAVGTRSTQSHWLADSPRDPRVPSTSEAQAQGDSSLSHAASLGLQTEPQGMPPSQSWAKPHVPKHLMPKPFDGTGNWSEFLVQFNVCAQLGQWTDFVKAQTIGGLMAGKALTTYCAIPERDRASFTNLVSALTLKFQDRQNVARAKLESRVRNVNEKVQDLASDIWNLTCRAYPDFPLEYREQIGLEAFKRAVDVQLRLRLTDFKATSLDEAVNIIEQYESIMTADAQQKRRYSARAAAAKPLSAPASGEDAILKKLDQLTSHLKQLVGNSSKQAEGPTQGSPTGEAAAAAREEQFVAGGNRYPQRQGTMRFVQGCYLCGASGRDFHLARDCPQKSGNGQPSA